MTIASEITRINTNIENAYTACNDKGATMPVTQNSANLATTISSIPTATQPVISSLNVTPTTSAQTITAPSGTDGYSPVNVSAVTSSIDANITAGNIKDGVTILGVTGSYTGGGGSGIGIPREVSGAGKYQIPTTSLTFSLPNNATDIDKYALYYALNDSTNLTSVDLSSLTTVSGTNAIGYAFYNCRNLTSADLSSLTTVSGSTGMSYAFYGCSSLTSLDLSSLTTVSGSNGMNNAFYGCTSLTSLDLSSLTTISGSNGMSNAFKSCTNLASLDLSSLTTISGEKAMYNMFQGCTHLTSVDLSSLTTVSGNNGMYYAFFQCQALTTLSFPSLTSTSFGSTYTNQFNNMLKGVTGCTVHFPSNLQSVIGSWSDVTAGFGGTNTTVLFDLPSTEAVNSGGGSVDLGGGGGGGDASDAA